MDKVSLCGIEISDETKQNIRGLVLSEEWPSLIEWLKEIDKSNAFVSLRNPDAQPDNYARKGQSLLIRKLCELPLLTNNDASTKTAP